MAARRTLGGIDFTTRDHSFRKMGRRERLGFRKGSLPSRLGFGLQPGKFAQTSKRYDRVRRDQPARWRTRAGRNAGRKRFGDFPIFTASSRSIGVDPISFAKRRAALKHYRADGT